MALTPDQQYRDNLNRFIIVLIADLPDDGMPETNLLMVAEILFQSSARDAISTLVKLEILARTRDYCLVPGAAWEKCKAAIEAEKRKPTVPRPLAVVEPEDES